MRHAAMKLGCATAYAFVLASVVMVPGASAQDSSAHALAEKFSRAEAEEARAEQARQAEAARKADAAKKAAAAKEAARRKAAEAARQAQARAQAEAERQRVEAQRRADEAEMLRQARAEAETRRAAELKAQAERAQAERDEAERVAREVEERQRQEAKARLEAERKAARAQAQRLAREAEERRQAEARRAEEARKAEAARMAREVEERRRADERKAAEAERIKEEAKKQEALEAQRQQELRDIAEKFRLAREARERVAREQERARLAKKEVELEDTRTSLGGPRPADTYEHPPERVSVLLIVEPRRPGKATNPVLCIEKSCYISGGADDDADRVTRDHALGPGNTIGRRAGPCNKQRTCIYRDVYLGEIASIQPIDLGFWGHKRHDIYSVRPDKSCDVIKGRLFCASPVIGHGYRAWIVPEGIAARAGAEALEAALEEGLPRARSAALGGWTSTVRQDR